jgi:tetratricopeptide (TPR) repeat protein
MVKDQHSAAAELLESALEEDPKMSQGRLMLGTSYAELGRRQDAKAQFDLVLKDDSQSVQALIGMANILLDEGKSEDVIALCRRTLSLDERNPQAYTLLGEVNAGLGKPADAVPYFEKALEIQPKLTQNKLNLAGSLVEVEQYDRAQGLLGEVLRDFPKFPLANYNLGLLYEERGRLEDARSAYETEVSAYPGDFRARFNLGKVLFRLGDREGSLEQMREVMRIAPNRAEGYLFTARGLLQESADIDEIHALVEKGLSLADAPDTRALGFFVLADVYNRMRRPDKANEALRSANAHASEIRSKSQATKNP